MSDDKTVGPTPERLAAVDAVLALGRQCRTAACGWRLDDPDHNAWSTACGHLFGLEDGGPRENLMTFCCYCGNPIKEIQNVES